MNKKNYAEYGIYVIAILAIIAMLFIPTTKITGQVIGKSLEYQASSGQSSVEVKNTDSFLWNNVRISLTDSKGIEYNCPKMVYLKPGATATIDVSYCFDSTGVKLAEKPVKAVISTDEGSASFFY